MNTSAACSVGAGNVKAAACFVFAGFSFRDRLSVDFAVRQAPRRHMDKAYDHENSEVLVCKLRKTTGSSSGSSRGGGSGGKGGGGGCKDKGQPAEGMMPGDNKNTGGVCLVGEGEASAVEAAGAAPPVDKTDGAGGGGGGSGGGSETPCSERGEQVIAPVAATTTTARTTATDCADGSSLSGVSLSSSSSPPCENIDTR